MDAATIARETASRLRVQHPQARYKLDWKTPEQLLVAAVLAGGSRDAAINDVTKVLFARWPDTRAREGLHMARVAKWLGLTQADEPDQIERDLMQLLPRDTWVHFGAAGVLHGC
jgi:endonuclease III